MNKITYLLRVSLTLILNNCNFLTPILVKRLTSEPTYKITLRK